MLLNSFFVAMHHSQRSEWGTQIAAYVKPDEYLVTLVFPIEPKKDDGPPWCARAEHYDTPLVGTFEKGCLRCWRQDGQKGNHIY